MGPAALIPARCCACGRPGESLCLECLGLIRPPPPPPPGLAGTVALGSYTGVLRTAVHHLKFRGATALATLLGTRLAVALTAVAEVDVVLAVPARAASIRRRGFDQSVLLARCVARVLGVRYAGILVRDRSERVQHEASRRDRLRIDPFTFLVGDGNIAGCAVLVDDVVTTGATMRAAAGVLRAAGASVRPATVALTPPLRSPPS